jgi:hypothetical protein
MICQKLSAAKKNSKFVAKDISVKLIFDAISVDLVLSSSIASTSCDDKEYCKVVCVNST